jgi:hypothetical protein
MKHKIDIRFVPVMLAISVVANCSGEQAKQESHKSFEGRQDVLVYKVTEADGFLPLPMHDPDFGERDYRAMREKLHLISNFGVYQGHGDQIYLHDGLDFALPNGTPIFAVEAGYVRRVEEHGYVVIESETDSGYAFAYAHVRDILVRQGDYVLQGQEIGKVEFDGIEHVHLDRVSQVEKGNWSNPLYHHWAEDVFYLDDDMAPEIDPELYFFGHGTDNRFPNGQVTVLSGAVDIVAGIRDRAPYGHGKYLVDRLTPALITLEILRDGKSCVYRSCLDFTRMMIYKDYRDRENQLEQARALYKFHYLFHDQQWREKGVSYYIVSNFSQQSDAVPVFTSTDTTSWNTLKQDSSGQLLFPNGRYRVRVAAFDSRGNHASVENEVEVSN